MARENLPSYDESIDFFKKNAPPIMALGDRLVHSGDAQTAVVGRVVFSLLCHGLTLVFGRDRALAELHILLKDVNRKRMQRSWSRD